MAEKKNPEVNEAEELKDAEIIEAVDDEEEVSEDIETTDEADEATVAAESDDEAEEENEEDNEEDDDEDEGEEDEDNELAEEEPAKKKNPLQLPVIIAACIVVLALLAYFVFTGFFLKEPEGVIWNTEIEGATYCFDFKNDSTYKLYVGTVEVTGTYQKSKSADGDTLTIDKNIGGFYGGYPCEYTITGCRIFGNQQLSCTYGEGYDFTLNQGKIEKVRLEPSADFVPDEQLVGNWVFSYYGYEYIKLSADDKGNMSFEYPQEGIKYNGTYTIEDGVINFTFRVGENVSNPGDYSIDGDTLNYMGYTFVREGSEAQATADQLLAPTE